MKHSTPQSSNQSLVGWREWVSMPELGIPWIKAKIDTVCSSSLHALNIHLFERDGVEMVRFDVFPHQRDDERQVTVELPVVDYRAVRSSTGHSTMRPVISTRVIVCGRTLQAELTLANRMAMGFRMLLGRIALHGEFLVDPERSYLGGKPPKKKPRPAAAHPAGDSAREPGHAVPAPVQAESRGEPVDDDRR